MADLALPRSFAGLMMEAQAIATMARVFMADDPAPQPAPSASPDTSGPVVTPGALATGADSSTPPATVFTTGMPAPTPSAAQSLAGLRTPFTGAPPPDEIDAAPDGDEPAEGEPADDAPVLALPAAATPAGPASPDDPVLPPGSVPAESEAPLPAAGTTLNHDGAAGTVSPATEFDGGAADVADQPGAASASFPEARSDPVPAGTVATGLPATPDRADIPGGSTLLAEAPWVAGTAATRSERQDAAERADRPRTEERHADRPQPGDRLDGRDALSLHDTALRAEIAVSRRDQSNSIDVWSSDVLRQIAGDDNPVETGIIPSFILNAAMIPGWPPPRPFEMPTADGLIRLLVKQGPAAEEALLKTLAEHGGTTLMSRLRKMLARLSRSKRLKVLLGLTALMTTIEAAIEAIEAELLELSHLGASEDDISFDDAFHRRHLSA